MTVSLVIPLYCILGDRTEGDISLSVSCCFWSSHQMIRPQWISYLTIWLHSSGGRTLAQLQGRPLVVMKWLTESTAELWLAAETSWSVSTSPCQSGDCDMLQNQCYQSVLTISRTAANGEVKFINAINCSHCSPNFTSSGFFGVYSD